MLNSARVHYALDARSRDGAAWPLRKAAREVRREKIYSYYRYSLEFAQTSLPRSKRVAALSRGASAGPSRRMDGRRTREDQGGPGRTRKDQEGPGRNMLETESRMLALSSKLCSAALAR